MTIDELKADLDARIKDLKDGLTSLEKASEEIKGNYIATRGALQEAERMLAELNGETPEEPST